MMGRWVILLSPAVYVALTRAKARFLGRINAVWRRLRRSNDGADYLDHKPGFRLAAQEISERGFDLVVFGHTHYAQRVVLPNGALYLKTGFWLSQPHCVCLDRGDISFRPGPNVYARRQGEDGG